VIPGWPRLVVVLVAGLAAPCANACLNSYSLEIKALIAQGKRELALHRIEQLEREYAEKPSVELTNDLAVARILTGRHDEAITLLKDLEARHPGRAATAANLGTAYELKGWDAAALPWIREGIRRDPREHRGTEWVHVRILEAKQAMKKDPRWLESNAVMGLAFGDAPAPLQPPAIADHNGRMMSLEDTRSALEYQLIERSALVAPPDAIVADLYYTAAELQFWFYQNERVDRRKDALARRVEYRYATALRYGYPRKERVEGRMTELRRLEAARAAVTKP
jgi:hypothetical protein